MYETDETVLCYMKRKQGSRAPQSSLFEGSSRCFFQNSRAPGSSLKTTELDDQIHLASWLYNYDSQILRKFKIDSAKLLF